MSVSLHWKDRPEPTTFPSLPTHLHRVRLPHWSQRRRAPLQSQAITPKILQGTRGTDTMEQLGLWSKEALQATSPTIRQDLSREAPETGASSLSPMELEVSWVGMPSNPMRPHTAPRWMFWRPRLQILRPHRPHKTRPYREYPQLPTTPSPLLRVL